MAERECAMTYLASPNILHQGFYRMLGMSNILSLHLMLNY